MKIKIDKEEHGEIYFELDQEKKYLDYDAFDYLIENVYAIDDEVEYDCIEELEEYKKLLEGIIKGARTKDFRESVEKAKKAQEEIESQEENTTGE